MKKLYLVWYEENILNEIGILEKDNSEYKFYYTNFQSNDLQVFSKNGLFPGFYDLNTVYVSVELFPNITKRLPSKQRDDYNQILNNFKVKNKDDRWEILEKTEGKNSDDYFLFVTKNKLEMLRHKVGKN